MRRSTSTKAFLALAMCAGVTRHSESAVVRVPQDFASIQAAIDAAANGDIVKVAPGTWAGGLVISGKRITLASTYVDNQDPAVITQTIIDGGAPILTIEADAGVNTTVQGFTFLNGDYQVYNYARGVNILNNRFVDGGGDQLSFEDAGGVVRDCLFSNAGDDGIDCDGASNPLVDNCTIQNAGDDGIEIRLHAYTGSTLQIAIRNNTISGCGEDGLQLIDYAGASSRVFTIEHNIFAANAMAGLGCTANGNSVENFAGAPLVEQVRVIRNTFSGNPHGLTGGDNMLVLNNIFAGSAQIAVKRVTGSSLVTYNDFWNNGTDHVDSNVNAATTLHENPLFGQNFTLRPVSPCIDAGAVSVVWNGATVTAPAYAGAAPDLGVYEGAGIVAVPGAPQAGGLSLEGVRPNPSRNGFTVAFTLSDTSPARLEVIDLQGRCIVTRELTGLTGVSRVVVLPETRGLPSGVYLVKLIQGREFRTARCMVVR